MVWLLARILFCVAIDDIVVDLINLFRLSVSILKETMYGGIY